MNEHLDAQEGLDHVADIFGHEDMRRGWGRGFLAGRLSHAHLIGGPEGIGKGTLARNWARLLLCAQPETGTAPDPRACGECPSCSKVASGNHPGYLEISSEGGGTIEIARMREILSFLALRSDGRRVVLIDSADQLREESANALLKILEEPPGETHFLLVSHRPASLLGTIISRCQRWLLGPLSRGAFHEVLGRHGISEERASFLYRGTGGRPGAALALEEALTRCGGEESFSRLLREIPADPRDLVALTLREGESFDRDSVHRTLQLLGNGIWAFRGNTVESRQVAATRALMLTHLAGHLGRYGSPDLVVEAAAMVLRSENPENIRELIPRVLGSQWV